MDFRERYAEFPSGGYIVRNNIWGEGHGAQTIWADFVSAVGECAPTIRTRAASKPIPPELDGEPAARRPAALHQPLRLCPCPPPAATILPTTSGANTTLRADAVDELAREDGPNRAVVECEGRAGGGCGGRVRRWPHVGCLPGTNGQNEVITFLCTNPVTTGAVDIKAILDWIKARLVRRAPARRRAARRGAVWLGDFGLARRPRFCRQRLRGRRAIGAARRKKIGRGVNPGRWWCVDRRPTPNCRHMSTNS